MIKYTDGWTNSIVEKFEDLRLSYPMSSNSGTPFTHFRYDFVKLAFWCYYVHQFPSIVFIL